MTPDGPTSLLDETIQHPAPSAVGAVHRFPVSEIYGPVIQGEGELIGIPTLFVRFGGCDYRCSWCDSLHAVLPQYRGEWTKLTVDEILDRLAACKPPPYFVTLSGGNPALHPLGQLVRALKQSMYWSVIETQGSVFPDWLIECDSIVLSPKPPSSGECLADLTSLDRYLRELMGRGHKWFSVKVVIFDGADLDYADRVRCMLYEMTGKPLVLQVGNPDVALNVLPLDQHRAILLDRYAWLADEVLGRGWSNVRVLPQLHTLVYSNLRGT
jgi:7-carboxy-7-deazaguanine synthase